ncbi:MAG: DUF11 domain-containing protein [Desulfobacteraceae bacterium]|nr:DUF11 domain-containing protein [Desulfobacteraceae bacterium]
MNGDVSPGDTLKYTVILQNTGNQDATGVKFTDYLPKNVTYIPGSAIADAGTVVYNIYMNRIEWIGDIGGGTSAEISFHVTVDANLKFGDLVQNQGAVAYDTDCDSINDASETTDSNPDEPGNQPTDIYARGGYIQVTAVKQIANASGTSVRPGDEPEYTIILKNHSGYYAQGIEFTDSIPDNAVYVQGSATVPADSIPVFEESVLSLTNIAIPAYGKVSFGFRVKLKHVLATGVEELTNQGAVYYDSDGDGVNETCIKTDSDTGQDGEQPAVTGLIIPYATCFANGISFTTATLNGALNPGAGYHVYYFEYGKTTDYGSGTDEKYAGQGHRNLFVSEHIKGLDEGETYHCRLVVMIGDETYYGADTSFTTSYTAPGPDAVHKNDPAIVAWATGWEDPVEYGIILNDRFMTPENALGKADCDTSSGFVSLGTGGTVTLTFSTPVTNGTGYDFAVFENSATDTSLELAYVEVSSDGENFVRFDNESSNSGGNFGQVDSSKIRGFAGKYRQGYGTLFDLAVLTGKLNIEKITHIRITDVFGGRDRDTQGNIIYDATYNLTSARAGFDLDAIGVIHSRILPGDINGDSIINLNDLILALKILAGSDTDPFFVYIGADVNNDRKIGFEEVGWILRKTSKP